MPKLMFAIYRCKKLYWLDSHQVTPLYFYTKVSRHGINLFYFKYLARFLLFTLPNVTLTPPGTYKTNVRGLDACGQQNIRGSARDSTGQNTKNTHHRTKNKVHTPSPDRGLKSLNPPGIEPGSPCWKAGILPITQKRWTFFEIRGFKLIKTLWSM